MYTKESCNKCILLKNLLIDKMIGFSEIRDQKELMMMGSKHRIMSAPIVEFRNKVYSCDDFINNIYPYL